MTLETSTFNPAEFELRNYTNPYVTPEQADAISLVESRVNDQLDFLAQSLGWNGPNYWGNLPETPDQKRQLLAGSFGVYNSFFVPNVREVRNWNNSIVVDPVPIVRPGRRTYTEKVVLGDQEYQILEVNEEGDFFVIFLENLPESFFTQISDNQQIKLLLPFLRPAPFYRPDVGVSGDAAFTVSKVNTTLQLYPLYDTENKFEYLSLSFFADSLYYFDQPVCVRYDLTNTVPDILPEYDQNLELWVLRIPRNLVPSSSPITVYLCWDYSDPSSQSVVSVPVLVQSWDDPSDWNTLSVAEYFTGAWGNKGGPLPFNLAFDSLSIHGVSEENAIFASGTSSTVDYNLLMESVYSQQTSYDITAPGNPEVGDLWWNPATGALCSWYDPNGVECGFWVEESYRSPVEPPIVPNLVYPDVASWAAAAPTIPQGLTVQIIDGNGLSTADGIIGLTGTITTNPSLIFYQNTGSPYWTVYQFTFADPVQFETSAEILPANVQCVISNANGLSPSTQSYLFSNLSFQVLESVPALVVKRFPGENLWDILPDLPIKFISQSSLNGYPLQGEMWWDYGNPVYSARAASIYYENAWVSVNLNTLSAAPAYFFDPNAVVFYADGELIPPNLDLFTGDYKISYSYETSSGAYEFSYEPTTYTGELLPPKIEVSDSIEGTYRRDISDYVVGNLKYSLTPTVADSETPLRIWKTEFLQDVETLAHLAEQNYSNPLVADRNNGPGLENWERYFVRLPLDYERNGPEWQKTALICQNFGYWGSSIFPEYMRCPPEDDLPEIYEELTLYGPQVNDYTYVYSEPYLYSNVAFFESYEVEDYDNAGIFPGNEIPFDGFDEGYLQTYDPLHNRLADTSSGYGEGYGDWEGTYVNINPCSVLSGFLVNDLEDDTVSSVSAPIWDASIYKIPPTCQNSPESYSVDSNHYKLGYAYFVADASAAEEGFFDPQQQSAWRFSPLENNLQSPEAPSLIANTLYISPSGNPPKHTYGV